ncbi:hypothetical protein J2Y63_001531 [Shinella sp. BE166]|uniref:hypothetical protein n=1 Tax=Shinella sp. BE166 TaxID=3373918 RepID=UPI003EB89C0B
MTEREMTMAEILKDPLIRQMMRADGVSLRQMRQLLRDAARARTAERHACTFPGMVARERASPRPEA